MTCPVDQGQASAVEEWETSGWLLSSFWEPDYVELSCLSMVWGIQTGLNTVMF
jgi:hypothetical protein